LPKIRTISLPDGEKKFENTFIRFRRIHESETPRRTDTARRHRPRLCIASRGKNYTVLKQRHIIIIIIILIIFYLVVNNVFYVFYLSIKLVFNVFFLNFTYVFKNKKHL